MFDPDRIGRIEPTHDGRFFVVTGWERGGYFGTRTRSEKRAKRLRERTLAREAKRQARVDRVRRVAKEATP